MGKKLTGENKERGPLKEKVQEYYQKTGLRFLRGRLPTFKNIPDLGENCKGGENQNFR